MKPRPSRNSKKFGTSQEIYRRTDWDGNGIKEYAQNIGPNGGNGNSESLYQSIHFSTVTGLMDDAMVPAEIPGHTGLMTGVTPRTGYAYFVQLGAAFPTVLNYVSANGAMTTGYGINAVPFQYDLSGRACFQMDSGGVIYRKDSGGNQSHRGVQRESRERLVEDGRINARSNPGFTNLNRRRSAPVFV